MISDKTIDHHFTLSDQYAALILPLAIFLACRALNDDRLAFSASDFGDLPAPFTPC